MSGLCLSPMTFLMVHESIASNSDHQGLYCQEENGMNIMY